VARGKDWLRVSFNTSADVVGGVGVSSDQRQVQPGSQRVDSTDTL